MIYLIEVGINWLPAKILKLYYLQSGVCQVLTEVVPNGFTPPYLTDNVEHEYNNQYRHPYGRRYDVPGICSY